MKLIICPGCKQNAAVENGHCDKCGFDLTGGPDARINRAISLGATLGVVGAVVAYVATNRRVGASPTVLWEICVAFGVVFWMVILRFVVGMFLRPGINRWGIALVAAVALMLNGHARFARMMRLSLDDPRAFAAAYPGVPASPAAVTLMGMSRGGAGTISITPTLAGPAMINPPPAVPLPASLSPQFAPLVRSAGELFASLAKDARAAHKEFDDDAGLRHMAAPEQLAQAKKTPASRQRIQRLLVRLDQLDAERRRTIGQFPAKVQSINVPAPSKARFLAALKPAAAAPIKGWTDFVTLQRKVVQQTDAVLAFVQSAGDRFTLKQGQLAFTRRDEQAKYDQLQRELRETVARRDEHLSAMPALADRAVQAVQATLDQSANPTTAPAVATTGS
jgi:hypothetical protein